MQAYREFCGAQGARAQVADHQIGVLHADTLQAFFSARRGQQVVALGTLLTDGLGLVNFTVVDQRGHYLALVAFLEVEVIADLALLNGLELDTSDHSDGVGLASLARGCRATYIFFDVFSQPEAAMPRIYFLYY